MKRYNRALQSFENLKQFGFLEKVAVQIRFIQRAIDEQTGVENVISLLNEAWHTVQVEVMHHLVVCAQIPVTD